MISLSYSLPYQVPHFPLRTPTLRELTTSGGETYHWVVLHQNLLVLDWHLQ